MERPIVTAGPAPAQVARGVCIMPAVRFVPALGALLLAFSLAPAAAHAQAGSYQPTPPTAGALYQDGPSGRYLLGGTWLYRADKLDLGLSQQLYSQSDTSGWTPQQVPYADNFDDLSTPTYQGFVAWYRRDFVLPDGDPDLSWVVRFESVNNGATVWLNGVQIGGHRGPFVAWELSLQGILRSGVNRLVVRVDGRRTPADLPPGGTYLSGPPIGGWWNYGGIVREVYLRAVRRVDFQSVVVRPILRCPRCAARIRVRATLHNVTAAPQRVSLTGSYGGLRLRFGTRSIPAGGTWTAAANPLVTHPRLWAPGSPHLYRVRLQAAQGSRQLGSYSLHSGIRSITVTRDGRLLLNGRPLHLRGVGLHEDDFVSGGALSNAQREALFARVLATGADLIRAHYPLHPEFQELADRYGVLLWSEIPVYQVAGSYLTDPDWTRRADGLLRTNIATNQNHPSVLLWSIANELDAPAGPGQAQYVRQAAALARRLDPTRPVAMAVSGAPTIPCQPAYRPLDVIGFNDYFGWYTADGSIADRDGLSSYLDYFRACYPHKALMVSEFGFEANRDGPIEEQGTYAFQADAIAYHLSVYRTKPWLAGAVYWTVQDFRCRPHWTGGNPWADPPYFHKGVFSLAGVPKVGFYALRAGFKAVRQYG
jgi:beta-glucuronidase